jgi:hypothetical protein
MKDASRVFASGKDLKEMKKQRSKQAEERQAELELANSLEIVFDKEMIESVLAEKFGLDDLELKDLVADYILRDVNTEFDKKFR